MKSKHFLSIMLSTVLAISSIQIPVLAGEISDNQISIEEVSENSVSDTDITTEQETLSEESIPVSADNATVSENKEIIENAAGKNDNNSETISENNISHNNIICNTNAQNIISSHISISEKEQKILDEKVDKIISKINPIWSQEEIALYLHNWLCLNCNYDKKTFEEHQKGNYSYNNGKAYTAYGAIVEGLAVCDGYSHAYELLCNKTGIICARVHSDGLIHAWNIIQIDGKNYYVDITADDGMDWYVSYQNFMLSRDASHEYHPTEDQRH